VRKSSEVESAPERVRVLNAVVLQNAVCVLNAMLSAAAYTTHVWSAAAARCSTSQACAAGTLPRNRAALIPSETLEVRREVVLNFPSQHMRRVKAIG
jgi:hypothetical protein